MPESEIHKLKNSWKEFEKYTALTNTTRLNNAPVSGFERDAGSRTTIRLLYPEGAPHSANEYKKTTIVALVVFKSLDLDWLTSVITKQPLVSLREPLHTAMV